jgi:hypothetical protein
MEQPAMANSGGAPTGYTGAPGEGNCSGCHGGNNVNESSVGSISVSTDIPSTGWQPNQSYTITVSVTASGKSKFGFQSQVVNASTNNTRIGTVTAGTSSQANVSGSKTYLTHLNNSNTGTNGRSWTYTWTAPSSTTNNARVYTSVVVADNANFSSGDYVYTNELLLTAATPTSILREFGSEEVSAFYDRSTQQVWIDTKNTSIEWQSYQIVNASGQLIQKGNLTNQSLQSVNLLQSNNGLIIVTLYAKQGVKTIKLF